MNYIILPRPHANSRYQAGALNLARAEVTALLQKAGVDAEVSPCDVAGVPALRAVCDPLSAEALAAVSRSAHLYLLCEAEEGRLTPRIGRRAAWLGDDLAAVLKYKGKTNETFTAFMLNMALCASDFGPDDRLTVLDPMCGRGTTLFEALNAGWSAVGVDRDAAAVDEGMKYFVRYLEYHRVKHSAASRSLTAGKKQACVMRDVTFSPDPARYKAGDTRTLSMACLPGEALGLIYKKPMCDLIVCDLPYGVQHAPGGAKGVSSIEDTLYRNLPVWVDCLRTGGAVAVAFNTNTLKTEIARGMLAEVGLDVMDGPVYDGLSHWVEQAITRDVAVAVRRF